MATYQQLAHLRNLPLGTRVRIPARSEFGIGVVASVLGENRYGIIFPDSRLACPVSTDGMHRSDWKADEYYPNLDVVEEAPPTDMQRRLAVVAARVQSNIRIGRADDVAREEAIELFRLAECIVPAEPAALPAVRPVTCPGCSGSGVLTDDPQVLRCQSCGGIFTDPETPITRAQALKFVALLQPMLPNAGTEGTFYFDLDLYVEPRTMAGDYHRVHGWADRRTKRVVQWG